MNPRDDIYAALSGDPNDWTMRSILVRVCDEAGEQTRADCLRWAVAHMKRAHRSDRGQFQWFNQKTVNLPGTPDPESDIPEVIYMRMKVDVGLRQVYRDYKTLADA